VCVAPQELHSQLLATILAADDTAMTIKKLHQDRERLAQVQLRVSGSAVQTPVPVPLL
jgi:hypothetical protein